MQERPLDKLKLEQCIVVYTLFDMKSLEVFLNKC